MENNHEYFMKEALKLARKNMERPKGGPFGAVIVKNGKIISEGYNVVISKNDPTGHAEIVAIRNACMELGTYHLHGCTIYSSCEPCPMCLGAIYWARLEELYFSGTRKDAALAGFDDDHIYREFTLDHEKRSIPTSRILSDQGKEVFNAWNGMGLNINY